MTADGGMTPEDAGRWRAARTLADLGEVTAQWLEGKITSIPTVVPGYGPDEETADLIPARPARPSSFSLAAPPAAWTAARKPDPGHPGRRPGNTWFGYHLGRADIEDDQARYGICHPDAVKALCTDWQVTIIDPEWGRNDVLWPVLESFAAHHQA